MRLGQRGFTLVEVMVALMVLALGMVAVYNALGQAARNANGAREQIFADWIAMDRIAELRIAQDWPALGSSNGEIDYGGQVWQWEIDVQETPVDGLRRVDVSVDLDGDGDPIATRSGFVRQAGNFPSAASVPWRGIVNQSGNNNPGAAPGTNPNRPGPRGNPTGPRGDR